ncbi:MAG: Crp/Fnr family transcriptional regulator [Aestuariivirga sp.]|nr:Crp/Fnr family transcriptional regulator [Aestuariivirga sp.]
MPDTNTKSELTFPKLGVLGRIGWMADQPSDFQSRMAKLGRWMSVRRGQPVYAIGDQADGIFGLGEGLLDVSVMLNSEREVVLHRGTPGFWIGDAALLGHSVRTLGVTAASDCQVFKLPAATVLRNLEENPRDWICFYKLSHINVMISLKTLAEVISLPPRALFARALLRLATPEGRVHMTQEELSRMVGMSRTSFRRALAALIGDGVIELDYGTILIRNLAALEIESQATDD